MRRKSGEGWLCQVCIALGPAMLAKPSLVWSNRQVQGGRIVPLIARLENPADERAYVTSERASRIPASRALIVIAIATFISYLMLNPMHFPRDGVIEYSIAAGIFILGSGLIRATK